MNWRCLLAGFISTVLLSAASCQAEENANPGYRDDIFIGLSAPLGFSGRPTLSGDWSGGLGTTLGAEHSFWPVFSGYFEGVFGSMYTNDNLARVSDPNQPGYLLGGAQLGGKFRPWPRNPVVPYFSLGLGMGVAKVQALTQYDAVANQRQNIPETHFYYQPLWSLKAGLDIPCGGNLLAFIELYYLELDEGSFFGATSDAEMLNFNSGFRVQL